MFPRCPVHLFPWNRVVTVLHGTNAPEDEEIVDPELWGNMNAFRTPPPAIPEERYNFDVITTSGAIVMTLPLPASLVPAPSTWARGIPKPRPLPPTPKRLSNGMQGGGVEMDVECGVSHQPLPRGRLGSPMAEWLGPRREKGKGKGKETAEEPPGEPPGE